MIAQWPTNGHTMDTKPVKKRLVKKKAVPENTLVSVKEEEKQSCPICIEPYNKVANTEIECHYCNKSACRRCIQTFLTNSTNDPHCMHCSRGWEREFIDDNLTMAYRMNDYKKHREKILNEQSGHALGYRVT